MKIVYKFASAYLQGRVRIPIGGIVREPKGTNRWNYGTDSDPVGTAYVFRRVSLDERRIDRPVGPVF